MNYLPEMFSSRYPIAIILILLLSGVVGCNEDQPSLFTEVHPGQSHIDFSNYLYESEDLNIVTYLYAHNGGGVAIGDINNDGLADIYFTANQLPNKLYLNKGNMEFEDITEAAGVAGASGPHSWSTGVTMADVNGDGYLDIYLSVVGAYKQFSGHNQLYINNADLSFTEASEEYGLDLVGFGQQAFFFDYDLDGDLDMYQLNHAVHKPEVYSGVESRKIRDSLSGDRLLRNDGQIFTDVTESAGIYGGSAGYGLDAGIADLDDNGCPDIYVSNDFHENDFLYFNNCDGTFTERGTKALQHTSRFSMGNDIADINNDGLPDIFTTDMKPYDEKVRKMSAPEASPEIYEFRQGFGYQHQYSRNMLQLNRGPILGQGTQFSEVGQQSDLEATDWSWSPLIADLDNDGWKDIFITNGIRHRPNDLDYINFTYNQFATSLSNLELAAKMPDGTVPNMAYKNMGALEFQEVSRSWGLDKEGYSMGSSYADLDNDGDLDLVVNNLNGKASLYKNNARELESNNFLQIKLIGDKKNRFGIGAKIHLQSGDKSQTLEMHPGRGWLSSVDPALHFGLGKEEKISSLRVIWPDGRQQELKEVAVNSLLTLNIDNAHFVEVDKEETEVIFKRDLLAGITYRHRENDYNDFQTERLMPRKHSKEGPRIALGDINADGLSDFYLGGAAHQAGSLYVGSADGSGFRELLIASLSADSKYEDTDAVFFDFDGDSDQDLYVVSGGSESGTGMNFKDRIYRNDGNENFVHLSETYTPAFNASTAVAGDFDGDRHADIFVGARSVPGSYGLSPNSTILWNQGDGQLRPEPKVDLLLKLGMVTDATFLPDSKELVVVGEWMPVTIISFKGRELSVRQIPHTAGWWNTIEAHDMDGDGDLDLLAGNQGTNSGFKPTAAKPMGLYVKDFDGNGKTDPIITYWKQDKEWIFHDLDELKGQLISMRKQFRDYEDFASKTADQVLTTPMKNEAEYKKAETLESVYIENKGDGQFSVNPLPKEAQWSPIFGFETADFDGDNLTDMVTVGNYYAHPPSIGKADASYGTFLKGDGKGGFIPVDSKISGWVINGEARDVKIINHKKGHQLLLVSRNNDTPLLFSAAIGTP